MIRQLFFNHELEFTCDSGLFKKMINKVLNFRINDLFNEYFVTRSGQISTKPVQSCLKTAALLREIHHPRAQTQGLAPLIPV